MRAGIKPEEGEYMCLRYLTIPTGRSSYPVTITANRMACSGDARPGIDQCLPNGDPPPLPAGAYHVFLFGAGSAVKSAPPPTVHVIP